MDILKFQDVKTTPDIIHNYTSSLRESKIPILIDNGSYQCRVGWSNQAAPLLTFKNLLAKPRKERSKKDTIEVCQIPQLQVGNNIINVEAVRFQLKTQFDRNVVTHFEVQEHLFDYTFTHLGIDTENCVLHPILITEAFLNPNSSRQLMSELLFECYSVPSVCYGIDSLFAYNYSHELPQQDALIVSLGYHTMHVIPVLDNNVVFANTRRINIGGFHVLSFLHKMLQLKYPAHSNAITLSRVEELLHSVCLIALDYKVELNKWLDSDYYEQHTKRIQLPYTVNVFSTSLTAEQQKERKKELARRLTEINARKREERLAEDEDKLQQLLEIQTTDWDNYEQERLFAEHEIRNLDDLQKSIALLKTRIEKAKRKITGATFVEEIVDEPQPKQVKTNKIVFENEKAMHSFIQNVKKKKQEILNRKAARKQRKQDMAKRRTAAGQERMRIISQLARKEKGNDDFGLRDEDWDIYKTISRDGGDSDSETENEKLLELEDIIRTHEPGEEDECTAPGEAHQLHIGIERYRAPELLFKPYMVGSSEAGLSEVIGYVLSLFNNEEQSLLSSNVVLIGGLTNLYGLRERIYSDLISIRPFKSFTQVTVLPNNSLSAWTGAKVWSQTEDFTKSLITRKDYEEYGGEYLKSHKCANFYYPTPKEQILDIDV